MAGRPHLTPEKKAKVIAMLELGFTQADIANQLNTSLSTVQRIRRQSKVKRGTALTKMAEHQTVELCKELSDENFLRQKLLKQVTLIERLVTDSQQSMISVLAVLNDPTRIKNLEDAALSARAITALSVATKNHADTICRLYGKAVGPESEAKLPVLVVEEMTSQEVADMREQQRLEDNELRGELELPEDDEIIELE